MTDLLEIVLIALACPFMLPTIIEADKEKEERKRGRRMNKYQKNYYLKNREKILARQKEYNARHKDEKALYDHLRNLRLADQKAEYNREYWKRRKEKQDVH